MLEQLKMRIVAALKAGRTVEKEILRLALGELQTAEARAGRALSDEESVAVLRKLVKSNEETLALASDATQKAVLQEELAALRTLLPASLSVDAIVVELAPVADAIRAAKNDGAATGIAMGHFKRTGALVLGPDVATAVKQLRGGATSS
jgi:uncharacterized protein YqeY